MFISSKQSDISDRKYFDRNKSISGLADQYADGKAAKVWQLYIGDQTDRTTNYKTFLVNTLKSKGCHRVLDAACGTGWVTNQIKSSQINSNQFNSN